MCHQISFILLFTFCCNILNGQAIKNIEDNGPDLQNTSLGTGSLIWEDIKLDNSTISNRFQNTLTLFSNYIRLQGDGTTNASEIFINSTNSDLKGQIFKVGDLNGGTNTHYINFANHAGNSYGLIGNSSGVITISSTDAGGWRYDLDYSGGFTSRSIVDKEYVDSHINGRSSSVIDGLNSGSGPGFTQDKMALTWDNASSEYILSPSISALSNGEGTTSNGSSIDLGGTITTPTLINLNTSDNGAWRIDTDATLTYRTFINAQQNGTNKYQVQVQDRSVSPSVKNVGLFLNVGTVDSYTGLYGKFGMFDQTSSPMGTQAIWILGDRRILVGGDATDEFSHMQYRHDYSANFASGGDRVIPDVGFMNRFINGKPTTLLDDMNSGTGPGANEDGHVLFYDHANSQYNLKVDDSGLDAGNGLTENSGNVELGGVIVQNTVLTVQNDNRFLITGDFTSPNWTNILQMDNNVVGAETLPAQLISFDRLNASNNTGFRTFDSRGTGLSRFYTGIGAEIGIYRNNPGPIYHSGIQVRDNNTIAFGRFDTQGVSTGFAALYAEDYSSNFSAIGDRVIPDVGYMNRFINGKPTTAIDDLNSGSGPGAAEDGFALTWNNNLGEYTLSHSLSALSGGQGTTFNGSAVDLGGTITSDVTITRTNQTLSFTTDTSGPTRFRPQVVLREIGGQAPLNMSVRDDDAPSLRVAYFKGTDADVESGVTGSGMQSRVVAADLNVSSVSAVIVRSGTSNLGGDVIIGDPFGGWNFRGMQYNVNTISKNIGANENLRWIPDLDYVIHNLGRQSLNSLVVNPTSTEDGYAIKWDDINSEYKLGPTSQGTLASLSDVNNLNSSALSYWDGSSLQTSPSLTFNGTALSIGSSPAPTGYMLSVTGDIIANRVTVDLFADGWPDYVFKKGYELISLEGLEQFIKKREHLPGIPSSEEVEKKGIDLGEMNAKLLQKIEELTLYIIEQNKRITKLESQISSK